MWCIVTCLDKKVFSNLKKKKCQYFLLVMMAKHRCKRGIQHENLGISRIHDLEYIKAESLSEGPEGGWEYQSHFPVHFFSKSHFAILKSHSHFWFLTFFSHSQWPNPSPSVAWTPFSQGKTCQSQFPFYPFRTLLITWTNSNVAGVTNGPVIARLCRPSTCGKDFLSNIWHAWISESWSHPCFVGKEQLFITKSQITGSGLSSHILVHVLRSAFCFYFLFLEFYWFVISFSEVFLYFNEVVFSIFIFMLINFLTVILPSLLAYSRNSVLSLVLILVLVLQSSAVRWSISFFCISVFGIL